MSESLKTNADILADEQAFTDACARAREQFARIEGVLSVGCGVKQTGAQFGEELAIVVFVREKKNLEEIPPEQRIPLSFEGYKTDVRTPLQNQPGVCDNTTAYTTIRGGIQIAVVPTAIGTLGCIARKRNDSGRDNVYALSNKHVLYTPTVGAGDPAYHPTTSGTQLGPVQTGAFFGDVRYTPPGKPAGDFFLDCAVARIDIDSICCDSTCTKDQIAYDTTILDLQLNGADTISGVRSVIGDVTSSPTSIIQKKVFKVGRTTGRTQGKVVSTTTLLSTIDPTVAGSPQVTGNNVIEIVIDPPNSTNCKGRSSFAEQGDSGSMILDEQSQVIGILHGVPPPNATNLACSACHILPVVDLMSISIPVTAGTSHGSTRATDGSGMDPIRSEADPALLPAGQIVFTAGTAFPVTMDEERHMRALLAELRATRKGCELHDLFGQLRREVGYLIRNHKLVKVAWHRYKGPAFLTHVLNHLRGYSDRVPREVDGVSVTALLVKMAEVLAAYGSNPVCRAIEKHYAEAMELLADDKVASVRDCLAWVQKKETAT